MSNAPKKVTKANLYPGMKYRDLSGDYTVSKDNYSGGKGFKANIKGEGQSGPSGGKMHPDKALEKGGKICKDGEYNAGSTYGKMGKTKTPSFKEVK